MATSEKLVVLSFTCGHGILVSADSFAVLYEKERMEGKGMALTKKEKEELQEFIRQEVENAVKDAMEYDRLEMARLVQDVEDFIGDHRV